MIYSPQKNPGLVLNMITIIVFLGLIGSSIGYGGFMIFAFLFWMHYTLVLVILQFHHKSKHEMDSLTGALLNPSVRAVFFLSLAAVGLIGYLKFGHNIVSAAVLFVWWLLAINFYLYYKRIRVREQFISPVEGESDSERIKVHHKIRRRVKKN